MTHRLVGAASLAVLAVAAGAVDAQELKSGLPVGSGLPAPLYALAVNGRYAGQKVEVTHCTFGSHPYLLIFARDVSDPLTGLVKKIDEAVTKHRDAKLGAVVVFCNGQGELEKKLKELADQDKLQAVLLSLYPSADGPAPHKVAKEAEVTVVALNRGKVRLNFAFRKGDLNEQGIHKVLADIPALIKQP